MKNTMPKDNLGNYFHPFTNHSACPLRTHFRALQGKAHWEESGWIYPG